MTEVGWSPAGIADGPLLGIENPSLSGWEGSTAEMAAMRPFKTLNLENGERISGKSAYDRGWVWVQRVMATL